MAETSLKESLFQPLLDLIRQNTRPMCVTDLHFNILSTNKSFANLLQSEEGALLNTRPLLPLKLLAHSENNPPQEEQIVEWFIDTRSSSNKSFMVKSQCYQSLSLQILTILEDEELVNGITDQKLLKNIFQHATESIVLFSLEGKIIDVNQSFLRFVNKDREDIIYLNLRNFVNKGEQEHLLKIKESILENEPLIGEMPVVVKDTTKTIQYSLTPSIYDGIHMVVFKDVTENRQMEIKLKRSEELFKELFEEAIDGIVLWKNDGTVIRANRSALKIFESTEKEMLSKNIKDFVYPTSIQKFHLVMDELKNNGAVRDELLFLMPNCQLKQLEFTAKLHSVDQYNMMIVRNVSERYHILQELRRSEERFRKIFEGTFDGMIISDHDLRVVDINPIACGILSLNKDLVLGRDVRTIMNLPKKLQDRFNRYLSDLKEEGQGNITLEVPDSRDKTRFIEISSKYKVLSNLNLTVIRDITEQVEMQEQLRKSDTLSVVGELAAGIAHEIRNPMTALKGFIQLLENSMQEDHSMYFHVIKSELQRIESIITEFLILAKPQAVQYQDSNLEKIVQETVELLNAQALLHNVQIIIHCDKDLPKIYAEPNQLKQVFINIIKNAIEVMPSGGEVVLSLTKEKDNEVKISIKDTGAGIPKNKIKKLGEPFYTTKERGTGLGLMVSFKIIREHNGTIEVDSIENEGTTFHIRLPVHHEKR
ncbi:hypothetical protein Q75_05030 [Bacillus coahuilensis p1.1.43]|uniref:histidine kinase n=1 Tax=Bacillus coahuilensis p1.1.43 TaxID=1150625 RepID=A0A147KA69_9BACI|nr:PAS domain S-box protein [Bacillus coahuilensis]KUP07594.1 hypothetical protein Q75_05030 [Bacillus coahuilensis p1.1.43]